MNNTNRSKISLKESSKKCSDKRMLLQNSNIKNKRKIDRMYSNKLSNKSSKMPLNIKSTFQEKNLIPTLFKGNNENNMNSDIKNSANSNSKMSVKRDKNYYLNLLNDIYLNDSHFSNKNVSKKSNNILSNKNDIIKVDKNYIKKQTYNFSKIRGMGSSKDILRKSYQSSKKVLSTFSNDKMNKPNKLSIKPIKDNKEKSNRKLSNFSKDMVNKRPLTKFLSEKMVSKFKSNEEASKFKKKDKNNNFKASQIIINEVEYINETLKDENNENNDTIQKEAKQLKLNINNNDNSLRNTKRSRNTENDNLAKCYTKNNSNKNINSNKSIKISKVKKMYKTVCFCCLIKNDDSLSDTN